MKINASYKVKDIIDSLGSWQAWIKDISSHTRESHKFSIDFHPDDSEPRMILVFRPNWLQFTGRLLTKREKSKTFEYAKYSTAEDFANDLSDFFDTYKLTLATENKWVRRW